MSKDFFNDGVVTERMAKVYHLLKEGKKICPVGTARNHISPNTVQFKVHLKDGRMLYSVDDEQYPKMDMSLYPDTSVLNVAVTATGSGKGTLIKYIYTNPQFNSTMAMLVDGTEVHHVLSFMDLHWCDWEEYKPEMRVGFKANIYDCAECGKNHLNINVGFIGGRAQTSCPNTNKLIMLDSQ